LHLPLFCSWISNQTSPNSGTVILSDARSASRRTCGCPCFCCYPFFFYPHPKTSSRPEQALSRRNREIPASRLRLCLLLPMPLERLVQPCVVSFHTLRRRKTLPVDQHLSISDPRHPPACGNAPPSSAQRAPYTPNPVSPKSRCPDGKYCAPP